MPRALLDRLLRLTRALPAPPAMLAPFEVNPRDMIDLQRAAGRLARHVGLGDLTFVVAVTPKPPDVAGHVELRYAQREVFIEISDRLLKFPRAVLACLAHEVTHKYLHSQGIWLPDLLENERLTDTAAVFNGLGRLLISGCEDVVEEAAGDVRRVHHFKGGYLERAELAEAYCAVLLARGEAVTLEGLPDPAAEAVRAALKRVRPLLRAPAGLGDAVARRVRDEQALLAGAERELRALEEQVLPALRASLAARHTELRLNQDELARLDEETGPAQALARARAAAWQRDLDARATPKTGAARRLRGAVRRATEALRTAPGGDVPVDAEALRQLVCGACGGKLRLPADKAEVVAKCPHCAYRFLADTTAGGPPDPPAAALVAASLTRDGLARGRRGGKAHAMDDFTVEGRLYSAAECAQVRPGSGHVGLALSGGGSRTAAACIGALRTLRDLGLLAEVRAISAVSGATWCTVPFTFLPAAFDEDAFLGQRAGDPAKLQLGGEGPASLGHLPAGALGQRFTELGMSTLALLGGSLADGARGVPGHRLWSRQIAEQILVPFELAAFDEAHRPIDWFAPDAATEAAIRAHSPGLPARCYTVRASERAPRPELRVQIALRAQDDQGRTTLVPTFLSPTVAGIPGTACGTLDGRPVGGGGVSSYAFGGYRVGPTTLRIEAPLALSDLTGIASSAYAADQTEGITPLLGYFGPEWPMPAGAAGRFVDAGLLENSGVASLLACEEIEAIIAVVNPPQGMDRAGDDVVVEAQIARLFGYRPYDKRTGWQRAQPDDEGDGRHCQVFASDEGQFQQLLAALGDRRAAGDATAYSQALTTVDNARFAVRGGRQVRVLWVVQTAAARWMDALTPPVRLALGPKFPNIPTAFTALPAPQVNGLSHFADWLLDQSRAALEALFERR